MSLLPDSSDFKPQLRKAAQSVRDGLPMDSISRAIREHLAAWAALRAAHRVLFYYPFRSEVDLLPLAESFPEKAWFLPRIDGDTMEFYAYEPGGVLVMSRLGIPEPEESALKYSPSPEKAGAMDVILLPGVQFDSIGNRLGYGKGYYDRFLSGLGQDTGAIRVGVVPEALICEHLPHDPWDVRMDFLACERSVRPVTGQT